jgi:hypothetical protein
MHRRTKTFIICVQDRAGDTNLIIASKAGHKTIVEALIKRYADVDTKVMLFIVFPYVSVLTDEVKLSFAKFWLSF